MMIFRDNCRPSYNALYIEFPARVELQFHPQPKNSETMVKHIKYGDILK